MSEITINGHRFTIKRWTYGEKQSTLKSATNFRRDPASGETQADIDPWKLNDMTILTCTVSWDLVDTQGKPLSKTLEALHSYEDPETIEELLRAIQNLNSLSSDARKKS